MLNVRKLAAIDLHFLGAPLILTEFGLGFAGSVALGAFTMRAGIQRFHSRWMVAFGVYLVLLGLNYLPLFLHALDMVRDKSAAREIGAELEDRRVAFRKYRRQSLWLLVPLVMPTIAVVQQVERRHAVGSGER